MKRNIFFTILGALSIVLAGCGPTSNPLTAPTDEPPTTVTNPTTGDEPISDPTTEEEPVVDPDSIIVPDHLIIHFKNDTEDYSGLVFWLWSDGKEPNHEFEPTGQDENGLYILIDNVKETFGSVHTKVGVILKSKGSWSYQTLDSFIYYSKFTPVNDNGVFTLEVFCTLTARLTLDIVASAAEAAKDKVKNAVFKSDLSGVNVTTSGPIKEYWLYAFDSTYYGYNSVDQKKDSIKQEFLITSGQIDDENTTEFSFNIDKNKIKINCNYVLETSFYSAPDSKTNFYLSYEEIYNSDLFTSLVYTGDDLGATVDGDTTTFKVWSPVSAEMTLNLYKYGHLSTYEDFTFRPDVYDYPSETYKMNCDSTGVWSITIPKNLHGTYYTYTANNFGGTTEAVDPYAESAGLNGSRGMVVDWNAEDIQVEEFNALPDVWDKDETYDIENAMDLAISEVHIRDLTADSTWSDNPDHADIQRTYKGFIQKGTKYTENGKTVKTGFDHLEEYGVNAIQLLPVFDADNNEFEPRYNWGYNPKNFNVVDGVYSTNPKDGKLRINEFRELVAAFANNKNHTRIIMDVVYNHTSTAMNSNFQALVPYYYFRVLPNGGLSNGSGCGNEFKTEAPMASKFIVESLVHWATRYKIKGFRFDLMGLIDIDTMKAAKTALYEIDPDIVLYGEGWGGYGATTLPGDKMTNTGNLYAHLHNEATPGFVGGFNDTGRNALRGGNGFAGGDFWGFMAQGASDLAGNSNKANVQAMLRGANGSMGMNPLQTVNYTSCHDNFTLFDQLNYTLSDDGGTTPPNEETVVQASVAANGLVLMSNGIAFINGGEEIFRTKIEDAEEETEGEVMMYGKRISHNSYMSSDFTNAYKYDRKLTYKKYFDMYANLIQIRKLLKPVLYPENAIVDGTDLNFWSTESNTTGLAMYRKGKDGRDYHILVNGRSSHHTIPCGQHSTIFTNSSTKATWTSSGYNLSQYNLIIVRS